MSKTLALLLMCLTQGVVFLAQPATASCVGDCDNNSKIMVDELVKGVNIALGIGTLDQCPAMNCDGTGHVTVDCLGQAVNAALNGCPASPTPIVTPTPTPTPVGACVQPFPTRHDCFGEGPANACLNAAGGALCFDVSAPADCCWTATVTGVPTSFIDDVVITQGEAGCGNGQICFTYGVGCPHRFRHMGVLVGDKLFLVIQDLPYTPTPKPTATPLVSPTPYPTPFGGCVASFPKIDDVINAFLDTAGGTQCFDVGAAPDCCWVPAVAPNPGCSSADVLLTTGNEGGCGNGAVCFSFGIDTCALGGREITIDFGNKHFIAYQKPLPTPTPSTIGT